MNNSIEQRHANGVSKSRTGKKIEINSLPLVSIYVVTKNRCEMLRSALHSALQQTYDNIEIIVVDDGSTDGTETYLNAKIKQHPNVTFYRFRDSRGAPAARNKAIELARGDYVTGLDDDDELLPSHIESFMKHHPVEVAFLTCKYAYRRDSGLVRSHRKAGPIRFEEIRCRNVVGNQVFVERQKILAVDGFDESLKGWQDYDLWLRLMERFGDAYRTDAVTYIVDQSRSVPRITSSSNAYEGYRQFVRKHEGVLGKKGLAHQALNDLYNRGVRVSLIKVLRYARDMKTTKRAISAWFKGRWPSLYSRIEGL